MARFSTVPDLVKGKTATLRFPKHSVTDSVAKCRMFLLKRGSVGYGQQQSRKLAGQLASLRPLAGIQKGTSTRLRGNLILSISRKMTFSVTCGLKKAKAVAELQKMKMKEKKRKQEGKRSQSCEHRPSRRRC